MRAEEALCDSWLTGADSSKSTTASTSEVADQVTKRKCPENDSAVKPRTQKNARPQKESETRVATLGPAAATTVVNQSESAQAEAAEDKVGKLEDLDSAGRNVALFLAGLQRKP